MADEEKGLKVDISELIPRITEQVASELRQKATQRFEYAVTEAVAVEVKRYIAENIVPGVTKELEKNDATIRAAIVAGVAVAADALRDKIIKEATDRITGYQGNELVRKFVDAVFGGRGY